MVFNGIEWFDNAVVIIVLRCLKKCRIYIFFIIFFVFIFSVLFLFCLFIFPGEARFRFFYGVGVVMKSMGKNIK